MILFVALAVLTARADDTEAPPTPTPDCLVGKVRGKGSDLDRVPALVTTSVDLKNGCGRDIRGFRGRVTFTGATPELVWTVDLASYNPAIPSLMTKTADWSYDVGNAPLDMWIAAAPWRSMSATWTTQVIVFEDGAAVWLPDVGDDATRAEGGMEALGRWMERLNAAPVYVVK